MAESPTETTVEPLEATVDVAATPAQVWALVTDLPRMSSWSPQVVRTIMPGPVRLGARAVNVNCQGLKFWPTSAKVVRFDPHRDFAFRIPENGTVWSYAIEPTDTGTRIVHRREVPGGLSRLSVVLQDRLLGGVDRFSVEMQQGMEQTLARIKAELGG